MQGLAVVLGSQIRLSSKRVAPPSPVEDYDEQGRLVRPIILGRTEDPDEHDLEPVTTAADVAPLEATNEDNAINNDIDDNEDAQTTRAGPTFAPRRRPVIATVHTDAWHILLTAHVYPRHLVVEHDGNENDDDESISLMHDEVHSRIADVRLQVVPSEASLTQGRETHYRLELPAEHDATTTVGEYQQSQLLVSDNQRFLLWRCGADLILFQLRKPRSLTADEDEIPLPSYIAPPAFTRVPPVATQPKVVSLHLPSSSSSNSTTAITPTAVGCYGASHFWVGTAQGTLYVLVARTAQFRRYSSDGDNNNHDINKMETTMDIWMVAPPSLHHVRLMQLDWTANYTGDGGTLAILDAHQQVHLLSTPTDPVHWTENDENNDIRSQQSQSSTLILPTTTAVHALAWMAPNRLVTLSQEISSAKLSLTLWHGSLPCRSHVWQGNDFDLGLVTSTSGSTSTSMPTMSVHRNSGTVAVQAVWAGQPVVALYHGPSHTAGWSKALQLRHHHHHHDRHHSYHQHQPQSVPTHARLTLTNTHLLLTTWNDGMLRKHVYDVGWLSPPSSRRRHNHHDHNNSRSTSGQWANPLVLTAKSVWFPRDTNGSAALEWQETVWSHGKPRLAAWGGSSAVAVAADRGVCVWTASSALSSQHNYNNKHRWQTFSNVSAADRMRVHSLQWWNRQSMSTTVTDILVTVVEQVEEDADAPPSFFLAAWSPQWWEAHHQLVESRDDRSSWGLTLPDDCCDKHASLSMDILSNGDHAVVLVLGESGIGGTTHYSLYSLQMGSCEEREGQPPFFVSAARLATGRCEQPVQKVWLASATFGYVNGYVPPPYIATLGIWQTDGNVDALALGYNSQVIAQETVCTAEEAIVMNVWSADRTPDTTSWTFCLSNGKLVSWKLPIMFSRDETMSTPPNVNKEESDRVRWVQAGCHFLGKVASTESTSAWMMPGSGRLASLEMSLGPMPGSRFAYALAAGQSSRKMHRILGENFESEIFLPDFLQNEVFGPGDFVLLPPLFLPALYMAMLEDPSGVENYVRLPMQSSRERNVMMVALRLLVLNAVDRMATSKTHSASAREARTVFQLSVDLARKILGAESLGFARFVVELARQMEPSRFEHFLPLPPPGNESIGRLLDISSSQGSISLSLAALPLLSNKSKARTICASIFRICLSACMKPQSVHHSVRREASEALSDLFRFGLKLEDTGEIGRTDGYAASDSFDTGYYDDDDDDDISEDGQDQYRPSYSMFCGISRIFGGRPKLPSHKAIGSDSFIDYGYKAKSTAVNLRALGVTSSSDAPEGVTEVVSHMLRTLLLDFSHVTLWGSAGRMAKLLLKDCLGGLHIATKLECTAIMRDTAVRSIRHVLPKEFRRKNGLVDFFAVSISRCMDCLDDAEILQVVDLLRVLLKHRPLYSDDEAEQRATLLLVFIVVGHISGRLDNLVEMDTEHLIVKSYQKAIEPKLPPPPEPSSSEEEISQ